MTTESGADETTEPEVDAAELVARARELAPLLRENAEKTEQDRRVAEEVVTALRDAGLFRLTTPTRFGGYGLGERMTDVISVIFEVGQACTSTAWNISIDTASTKFAVDGLPETALAEVFADGPDAYVSSMASLATTRASRVDGGYVVTGTYPWSSGCEIADWGYMPATQIFDGDEPTTDIVGVVAPASDLKIERTWTSTGLAGSGTHTVIAEDLFVPEHRAVAYSLNDFADEDQRDTTLIQGSAQSLAATVGAAQGALEYTREVLGKGRSISFTTYAAASDAASVQLWFAEATHLIETARLHLAEVGRSLDGVPGAQPVSWAERARIRRHEVSAHEKARAGVEKLIDIVGGSAFAAASPLQRFWRDMAVASRHNAVNAPIIAEDYGRALLNVRPTVTLIY